jgi:uncharacterized membrane-anchored protein YhcB (DUF1043 family)
MNLDILNAKNVLMIVAILVAAVILFVGIKTTDDYFYNKKIKKDYKKLQEQYDKQKKELNALNKAHRNSVEILERTNEILQDSLNEISNKYEKLENEKSKIIYRIKSMSISEQQSYFTDRYKSGSNPRQYNGSFGNTRSGAGRHMLRTTGIKESGNRFFKQRYI